MIQNDIRKFLIRNSLITYASVGVAIIALLLSFLITSKAIDESRKYLYFIRTDGEIVPMEWINREEKLAVRMKHHLTMFVEDFYSLNQFDWESKVEKALWLGNFETFNNNRINKGYYNRFIQYGVEQKAVLDPANIELTQTSDGTIQFRIVINLKEKLDQQQTDYSILARGTIRMTSANFPRNPHGLYIENYVEEQIIKDEAE